MGTENHLQHNSIGFGNALYNVSFFSIIYLLTSFKQKRFTLIIACVGNVSFPCNYPQFEKAGVFTATVFMMVAACFESIGDLTKKPTHMASGKNNCFRQLKFCPNFIFNKNTIFSLIKKKLQFYSIFLLVRLLCLFVRVDYWSWSVRSAWFLIWWWWFQWWCAIK